LLSSPTTTKSSLPTSQAPGGLATDTKVGIAIGATVVALLFLGIAIVFWRRARQAKSGAESRALETEQYAEVELQARIEREYAGLPGDGIAGVELQTRKEQIEVTRELEGSGMRDLESGRQ
jgi:uncharacterized protein HemX